MKAMIFAAGLGTRLKPLTDNTPKALVKVNGKPLLQHNIEKIIDAGFSEIVINVHHFPDQIVSFLKEHNYFNHKIHISDESDNLLDTGGGLRKASDLLKGNEPVLLQNADILSGINYGKMVDFHNNNNALATLAVRKRDTSRYLLVDEKENLKGWQNIKSGDVVPENLDILSFERAAFSGIHILNPDIFELFPKEEAFNIIQWYVKLSQNNTISCFNHDNTYWFDIGTIDKLKVAEEFISSSER